MEKDIITNEKRKIKNINILPFTSSCMTFIEVEIDDGIKGIGCTQAPTPVIDAIINKSPGSMSELLIGNELTLKNFWNIVCLDYQAQRGRGAEGGYCINAASAIDIAFWDAFGKSVNQPINKLLGKPIANKIVAYASMTSLKIDDTVKRYKNNDELIEEAVFFVNKGFKALKIGWGDRFKKNELQILRNIRKEIGNEIKLMIDIGCPAYWNIEWNNEKIDYLKEFFKEINLFFIEEPLSPKNIKGYDELKSKLETKIACGESLSTIDEFQAFLENKSVDVIQPDAAQIGVSQFFEVACSASLNDILIIPHSPWAMPVIAAHLQILSLFNEGVMVEYPALESYGKNSKLRKITDILNFHIVDEPYLLEQGFLTLKGLPGLGIGNYNYSSFKEL